MFTLKAKQLVRSREEQLVQVAHTQKIEAQRLNHESLMILANGQSNDILRRRYLRAAERSLDRWRWLVANPPKRKW